jgi:hypothetical protein
MARTLSERVFAQLIQLPLRFHLDRQTGAVTQALTNGLQGYQMILQALVFTVLPVVTELGTVVCREICSKTGPSSAVEANSPTLATGPGEVLRAQNPPPRPPAPTAARVEIMSSGGQHGSAVLSADSAFKSI